MTRNVLWLAIWALALSLPHGTSKGHESIVRVWATPGQCGVPLSTVTIEPRRFSGDYFFCDCDSVLRQGDTVRWQGRCVFGDDLPKPSNVTARRQGATLLYKIGGDGWNGPLQRCSRKAP